ncbi:NAD(P)-binding domain-containing protein [Rozella allomycis CSF55]|uniref:3-hydroxyacyl-CoA dehydrogenase n=1 Tax=Rozella allomycis (strain CSF55) TaxID=988480 RepID=A0A075B1Y7_ROZAC|nr:NAD(P)-binding domain-containing protein [Rozella allomycis CSF55]|eukprot:EPZ34818.1 NAD(P)-binding domain-containing protein [Rozella allomycis CSF55]
MHGIRKRFYSTINNVLVCGSGLMGRGIAQVTAFSGYNVTLYDIKQDVLNKALELIKDNLNHSFNKQLNDKTKAVEQTNKTLARIKASTDLNSTFVASSPDLVIEAIIEDLEAKKTLFAHLDKIAPPGVIFASNTSSLSITDIASGVSRKDNFVGLHFFSPVPIMKLVEIVKTEHSSPETAIICKDTPGFIVNRLLVPYLLESVKLYDQGIASIKDIDTAMKLGAGYPMGPFELLDYVGLDVVKFINDAWHAKNPQDPMFQPSQSINKLVAEGNLGKKTGKGFYDYTKKNKL